MKTQQTNADRVGGRLAENGRRLFELDHKRALTRENVVLRPDSARVLSTSIRVSLSIVIYCACSNPTNNTQSVIILNNMRRTRTQKFVIVFFCSKDTIPSEDAIEQRAFVKRGWNCAVKRQHRAIAIAPSISDIDSNLIQKQKNVNQGKNPNDLKAQSQTTNRNSQSARE